MKKLISTTIYFLIGFFISQLFTLSIFSVVCKMIKYFQFNSLYLNLIELKYFLTAPIFSLLFIYVFKRYFIYDKRSLKSILNFKFINFKNSIYIIIFTLGQVVLISIFAGLLTKYIPEDNLINYTNGNNINFFLEVLITCIISPILEEIIFRGLLLNYLKKEFNINIKVAIILQAAIFAIVHLAFIQMMYTFISGILFAMLNIHYKSICASIYSHITFNILGSIVLPIIAPFITNFYLLFLCFGILCFSFGGFKIFEVKKENYLTKI